MPPYADFTNDSQGFSRTDGGNSPDLEDEDFLENSDIDWGEIATFRHVRHKNVTDYDKSLNIDNNEIKHEEYAADCEINQEHLPTHQQQQQPQLQPQQQQLLHQQQQLLQYHPQRIVVDTNTVEDSFSFSFISALLGLQWRIKISNANCLIN